MTLDAGFVETLLNMPESHALDFKQAQYPFASVSDEAKSELVKDILAFANAWKTSDAHIVIGVEDGKGQRGIVHGVTEQLDDANVQQLVNDKTNVPVLFEYIPTVADGKPIAVIRIARDQRRPIYLKKRLGPLLGHAVYIRRGSSTAIATPEEVAQMGASHALAAEEPQLELALGDARTRTSWASPIRLKPAVGRSDPRLEERRKQIGKYVLASMDVAGMPTEEESLAAKRDAALFTRMAFSIKNSGRVLLRDVRIVAELAAVDGLRLVDVKPRRKPRGRFGPIGLAAIQMPRDTTVRRRGELFEVNARMGKIQPSATVWSNSFWLGGDQASQFTIDVKVYADNLPAPVNASFELELEPIAVFDSDIAETDDEDDED